MTFTQNISVDQVILELLDGICSLLYLWETINHEIIAHAEEQF